MSEQVKVGKLTDRYASRDAIHVAVLPVQAKYAMPQGRLIEIEEGTSNVAIKAKGGGLGIVDPFLDKPVKAGDWFYMWLHPNTVTGMRHHWEHPVIDFEDDNDHNTHDEVLDRVQRKGESEKWLMNYAVKYNDYESPDRAYQSLLNGLRCGEIFFHGSDLHGLGELPEPDELAKHAEIVLGIRPDWKLFEFSCSC